ncbi:MAG: YhbY family RNA-binding protein [Spirochaeta sp.]|jgi:RNA-binding protein|nr:YhbY family RNA-binding protein [Spirochaeta sp.]
MDTDQKLQGYQRAALLRSAHHLRPVASVGRNGLTVELREHIDRELTQHELIKIRFVNFKSETRELTEQIGSELGAQIVATVGHTAVLFRRNPDPEQQRVSVPVREA